MEKQLLTNYANRFSKSRKKKFRNAFIQHLQANNIKVTTDTSILGTNIMFGNLESDKIFTAHYDTATNMRVIAWLLPLFGNKYGQLLVIPPLVLVAYINFDLYMFVAIIFFALLFIPNKYNYNDNTSGIITLLRHAQRNQNHEKYLYVLTDNEEKGLLGGRLLKKYMDSHRSKSYKVLNIDCVGYGDQFAISAVMDNDFLDEAVLSAQQVTPTKKITSKSLASDHLHFGNDGIMITKLNKAKYTNDFYIPHIHTNDDKHINFDDIDTCIKIIDEILKIDN